MKRIFAMIGIVVMFLLFFVACKKIENGHEYVDLGLPSGLKWATCNVGAESPDEYGDYFAWGEVEPKKLFNRDSYKYYDESNSTKYIGSDKTLDVGFNWPCPWSNFTKYTDSDRKNILELEDDAAHVNWGGAWRMPTLAEQQELIDNCTWTWTKQNGVNGYKVVGLNGNSIFFPAAGYMHEDRFYSAGSSCTFWSSSLNTDDLHRAYCVYFDLDTVGDSGRIYGYSVRPVCH